jgi:adenylylsulfate kinase
MEKILVMGLPGSGKTYFAERLKRYLELHGEKYSSNITDNPFQNLNAHVDWFNADDVRKKFNDWDFSKEGRIRQSLRMLEFAMKCKGEYVICDFVAPIPEMRHNFKADWTVWMDTIDAGRYEDTNKTFISPDLYDFRINEKKMQKNGFPM